MKNVIVIALACICVHAALAQDHIYGGLPSDGDVLERNAYVLEYDHARRVPRWVAYRVEPSFFEGRPPRDGRYESFRADPDVQGEARDGDYVGYYNGPMNYVRGHMAPYFIAGGDRDGDGLYAADDEDDQLTVFQVNYMTNIIPQHHRGFNGSGGLWYEIETMVRSTLVRDQGHTLWITAGPVWGAGTYDIPQLVSQSLVDAINLNSFTWLHVAHSLGKPHYASST